MPLSKVAIAFRSPEGIDGAKLVLSCRPGHLTWDSQPALVNWLDSPDLDGASPVQLLEDIEYRYSVEGLDGEIAIEPAELFDPDDVAARSGRLRPRRYTGTVSILVTSRSGAPIGKCDVEVRSRKLGYLDEYRWMLGRIADEATEALMQRFGPSELSLSPTQSGTPRTTYQRFALLKALVESDDVDNAMNLIGHRPHSEYRAETETTNPARGLRPGRRTIRALTGPGPRMPTAIPNLPKVPTEIDRVIHTETRDTVPNRFVKHALTRWLGLAVEVRKALGDPGSHPEVRGIREAAALERRILVHLNTPLLNEVGVLGSFPADNQVLQRREGYRDVLRIYLMMEVAAALEWQGGEDVFRAGQRDVATLYEYWVFLELARIISNITDERLDMSDLFKVGDGQLSLNLQRRSTAVLTGSLERRGRRIDLRLYFNRQFKKSKKGSWTTSVRPDCSLHVAVQGDPASDTWLHFDAKYRMHEIREVLSEPISDAEEGEESATDGSRTVRNEDLLKMHAYRDAVRRTSGAFVLYPGSDDKPQKALRKYHEVLPGLGAFVLRPTGGGEAAEAGASALSRFINDVLDHVAAQGTSRHRAGFWEDTSYRVWHEQSAPPERRIDPVAFLETPADDTLVLLGYVKNNAHRSWVLDNGLYNLRADDRAGAIGLNSSELRASILVLYRPDWDEAEVYRLTGALYLKDADELVELGYPDPQGDRYLCLGLGSQLLAEGMSADRVASVAREGRERMQWGAPIAITWSELKIKLED